MFCEWLENTPSRREVDLSAVSFEKLRSDFFLERTYLGGDRRLSEGQLLGSTGEALLSSDFHKGSKLSEIHDWYVRRLQTARDLRLKCGAP
jgi:hypothetical protein